MNKQIGAIGTHKASQNTQSKAALNAYWNSQRNIKNIGLARQLQHFSFR